MSLPDSETSEYYPYHQYKELALFTQSAVHKAKNFMLVLVHFVQNPLNSTLILEAFILENAVLPSSLYGEESAVDIGG